jgi:plastocyanin
MIPPSSETRAVVKGVMTMDARTRSISVLLATLLLLIGTGRISGADAADFNVVVKPGTTMFTPQEITIKAGDRVIWVNEDREDHSVMSSGPVLEKTTVGVERLVIDTLLHPGASYTHSFHEPGTYPYFCAGHVQMWGAVTVEQ